MTVRPFSAVSTTLSSNDAVILDTSILVPFVDPVCGADEYTRALQLTNDLQRADVMLAVTMKTREELVWRIERVIGGRDPQVLKRNLEADSGDIGKKLFLTLDALNGYLGNKNLFFTEPIGETNLATLARAEELVLKSRLELPDALVIAQAEKEGFRIVATMDKDFLRLTESGFTFYVPEKIYKDYCNKAVTPSTADALPAEDGRALAGVSDHSNPTATPAE